MKQTVLKIYQTSQFHQHIWDYDNCLFIKSSWSRQDCWIPGKDWTDKATNGHFGHLGQSEESENGPIEFPMPQNLGIDTKTKSLACSEQKVQILPFELILADPKWPQIAVLAT